MALGWIIQLILFAGVLIFIGRKIFGRRGGHVQPHSLRRAFQYVILYGLVIVVGIGLSGLVARLLEGDAIIATDKVALALELSFTLVGIPIMIILGLWSYRQLKKDPTEKSSSGFQFYLYAASITSLIFSIVSVVDLLRWVIGDIPFHPSAAGRTIIWGAIWAVHVIFDEEFVEADRSSFLYLSGAGTGLLVSVIGLVNMLGGIFQEIFGMTGGDFLVAGEGRLTYGLTMALVGIPVWVIYWISKESRTAHDDLWHFYIFIVGIAFGLVLSLSSTSVLLYKSLVWLIGDTQGVNAKEFFTVAPTTLGAVIIGLLSWWYHQACLGEKRDETRSEVRRVYEYLISAIALIACAVGIATVIISFIDSVTRGENLVGEGAKNTLLLALTELLVAAPLWTIYWMRIQRFVHWDPWNEIESQTRKMYLVILFGIGGLSATISLIVGLFIIFQDLLNGDYGNLTWLHTRVPIALIVTTSTVAGYHWIIYRNDRTLAKANSLG